VHCWDLVKATPIAVYENPEDIGAIAVSPVGNTLACGGEKGNVYLWDTATGKQLAVLPGKDPIQELAFSPDAKVLALIAIGEGNPANPGPGEVIVWDVPNRRRLATVSDRDTFEALSFSPNGKALAVGNGDNAIKLYEPTTGKLFSSLQVALWRPRQLVFSPDGVVLAVGGGDLNVGLDFNAGEVKFWHLGLKSVLYTLQANDDMIEAMSLSPNGKLLAVAGSSIKVWDVESLMTNMKKRD
jgi:WD40 repeat protein